MISVGNFKWTICLALAGTFLLGSFMFVGVVLLGHVRPMWMELEYTPRYALYGLVAGTALGSAVDFWRSSAAKRDNKHEAD